MRLRFGSKSMRASTGHSTKSRMVWTCAFLACFTLGLCLPQEARSFDAAADFSIASNPNGQWSYLSGSLLGTSQANCNSNSGIACWQNGLGSPNFAGILQNTTISPYNFGFLTLAPGAFDVDPESNANVTILWTAPSAGTWWYSGFFSGLDTTSNAHTTYVVSTVSGSSTTLWTIPISGFGSGSKFSGDVVLSAGDTLGFVIATGSTYTSLGTGFNAIILVDTPDTDGDGVPDLVDNCLFKPNGPLLGTCQGPAAQANCHVNSDCGAGNTCSLNQEDTGGIGAGSLPDGIGDACQCGDADNNGVVNNNDATFIKRAVAGIAPCPGGVTTLQGFHKCDVQSPSPAPGDTCNNNMATFIQRAVSGLAPGIHQTCHAATIFP